MAPIAPNISIETELSGTIRWTMDGVDHREDGPAIIRADGETWCLYGEFHRLDGPAVIWSDNSEPNEWWVQGESIDSYEHLQEVTDCSDEDVIAMKLKWGVIIPWEFP